MPVPVWSVGQILSASDVNSWFVPVSVMKPSDQSVTSSTTLVNDNDLVLPVVASGVYQFQCFMSFEGANSGGTGAGSLKWRWIVPAGTNVRYQAIFQGTGGAAVVQNTNIAGDTPNAGTQGAGVLCGASMLGTVLVGSTAGSMQLQWAQVTSNATSTTMHIYSHLLLRRIG